LLIKTILNYRFSTTFLDSKFQKIIKLRNRFE